MLSSDRVFPSLLQAPAVVCINWNGIFPVGAQLRVGQQTLWPKQMFLGFKAISTPSSVFSIPLQA